ncbi:MAG TPA: monovalent cation/H(+) antiporter subunit G [Gammaproteobacteria bacterium]|jgi:multicomponent Na+:H+ antiporter subunit G
MIDTVTGIVSGISLGLGALLLISGSVGLLRFPDFYTRMHAAGVTDTLAAGLTIVGLMLISGWNLVLVKLVLILLFIFLTGPTASHALARAAQHGGLKPMTNEDKREE